MVRATAWCIPAQRNSENDQHDDAGHYSYVERIRENISHGSPGMPTHPFTAHLQCAAEQLACNVAPLPLVSMRYVFAEMCELLHIQHHHYCYGSRWQSSSRLGSANKGSLSDTDAAPSHTAPLGAQRERIPGRMPGLQGGNIQRCLRGRRKL
jgi:hypothetical protein